MIKHQGKQTDFLKKKKQPGRIYIQSTSNNTIITLTDKYGNTKSWASSGTIGFKNSRKSTTFGAQVAAERIIAIALALGLSFITIVMKGLGYGKQSAVRTIAKSKLKVVKIEDRTPVPHNGCRAPKKRRT